MTKSYQESLDCLFSLQFFGIKLGLDNIRSLLDRVGNPQQQLRIIHVAGTNGKGSTCAALTSILHAAGYTTGLYTSPHLHSFTERIRVNTVQVTEAEVVELIDIFRPHAEDLKATFFEVTTAMALLCFARHQVDWVVLETGMGGRLDATNAVLPEVSILTPIAFDHAGYLGDSLAAIAGEKAGIIKPGVPVVCAAQEVAAGDVIQLVCREQGSPLMVEGSHFEIRIDAAGKGFDLAWSDQVLGPFLGPLQGLHQLQNLGLAVAAITLLRDRGLEIADEAVACGLRQLRWPGRLEWLPEGILIDGAHNCAGVAVLADYLERNQLSGIHLIFGCKADKQAGPMLDTLLPFVARLYLTSPPGVDAVAPQSLLESAQKAGVAAEVFAQPKAALAAAQQARQQDILLIAGSLFLIAELRALIVENPEILEIVA